MKLWDSLVIRFHILFRNFFPAVTLLLDLVKAFSASTRCISSENVKKTLAFFSDVLGFLQKLTKLCPAERAADFLAILNAVQALVDVLASSKASGLDRAEKLVDLDAAILAWEA